MTRLFRTMMPAIILAGTTASPAAADCVLDWGKAAEIVKAEGLMTVEELAKAKSTSIQGQIVRATLCKESNMFLYKLVVRDGAGAMKNVVVDAVNPAKPAMSDK